MYRFLGRHAPESFAAFASLVALAGGSYLAWTHDVMWLNRSGSLVIVAGVLLAASRFQEWVQRKLRSIVEQNLESVVESAVRAVAGDAARPSVEERQRLRGKLHTEMNRKLDEVYAADKRRIRAWEVWLIVVGTIINGFGDLMIKSLKLVFP